MQTACTSSLVRLREAFEQSKRSKGDFRQDDFAELVEDIGRALFRFESISNNALLRLYRGKDFHSPSRFQSMTNSMYSGDCDVDNSLLAGNDHENVFLVYLWVFFPLPKSCLSSYLAVSFIFTLQEFSVEVVSLIDAIQRIYRYEQARLHHAPWWKRLSGFHVSNMWKWIAWRQAATEVKANRPRLKPSLCMFLVFASRHQPNTPFRVQPLTYFRAIATQNHTFLGSSLMHLIQSRHLPNTS